MSTNCKLRIGDQSINGQVSIIDEDRLCYLVESNSRGAKGVRTISKKLLEEFVDFWTKHPDSTPQEARDVLSGESSIDKFEYGYTSTLSTMAQMMLNPKENIVRGKVAANPIQAIYFGCPGSGKSYKVANEILKGVSEDNIFRTTFHPDSDYASFVGCYKPIVRQPVEASLSYESLLLRTEEVHSEGAYEIGKFAAKYHNSLKNLSEEERKNIRVKIQTNKGRDNGDKLSPAMNEGIAIGDYLKRQDLLCSKETISYGFVPQVFTNAYVHAWKKN